MLHKFIKLTINLTMKGFGSLFWFCVCVWLIFWTFIYSKTLYEKKVIFQWFTNQLLNFFICNIHYKDIQLNTDTTGCILAKFTHLYILKFRNHTWKIYLSILQLSNDLLLHFIFSHFFEKETNMNDLQILQGKKKKNNTLIYLNNNYMQSCLCWTEIILQ